MMHLDQLQFLSQRLVLVLRPLDQGETCCAEENQLFSRWRRISPVAGEERSCIATAKLR